MSEPSDEVPLTMDARKWAKDWIETIAQHPGVPFDEETMVTWFSNAIMAGHDGARKGACVFLKSGVDLDRAQAVEALNEAMRIIEKVGTTGVETGETCMKAELWMHNYYPQWA